MDLVLNLTVLTGTRRRNRTMFMVSFGIYCIAEVTSRCASVLTKFDKSIQPPSRKVTTFGVFSITKKCVP